MSSTAQTSEITRCPCCGSVTGTTLGQAPALLAVCDVLVVHALEVVGRRIIRSSFSSRSRFNAMDGHPIHTAHTLWKPDPDMTDKALRRAWDVVPAMLSSHGCCGVNAVQVTRMLDQYVRDLLITGTAHNLTELRYRFERYLGIPLVEPKPYEPGMGHG